MTNYLTIFTGFWYLETWVTGRGPATQLSEAGSEKMASYPTQPQSEHTLSEFVLVGPSGVFTSATQNELVSASQGAWRYEGIEEKDGKEHFKYTTLIGYFRSIYNTTTNFQIQVWEHGAGTVWVPNKDVEKPTLFGVFDAHRYDMATRRSLESIRGEVRGERFFPFPANTDQPASDFLGFSPPDSLFPELKPKRPY